MKLKLNKLTAAALTTLLATASQAQSSVTVYGLIDATVRYATNASPGGGHMYSVGDGAINGSRLGFKGNEDLGGGLKAIFALEMGLDPSTGTLQQASSSANYGQSLAPSGRAWGREAWVGLSSGFGTVQLGRQYTLAHTLSTRFQPLTNPNGDYLSFFSGHHVSRQDNMVKYSLVQGPVNLMASVTASEGNGKAWSVGGGYAAGSLDATAYIEKMDSFNGAETRTVWGAGAVYTIVPGVKAWFGYMKRSHKVSLQDNSVIEGAMTWSPTTAWTLTALYTQDKQTNVAAGKRTMYAFHADYFFSKRTDAYAMIDQNKLTGLYPLPSFMAVRTKTQTGLTVGLRHRF